MIWQERFIKTKASSLYMAFYKSAIDPVTASPETIAWLSKFKLKIKLREESCNSINSGARRIPC